MASSIKSSATSVNETSTDDKLDKILAPEGLSASQRMEQSLQFKPKRLSRKTPIRTLLRVIPLLSGFLQSVDHAGNSLSSIAQIEGNISESLRGVIAGYQFAGLALVIVDFIRIPIIYLAAAITIDRKKGETLPISVSNNARWAYAGILLGLAITALALPIVAVPIALTMASLGLGSSLFIMSNFLYQRYQLPKKLSAVKKEIVAQKAVLDALYLETIDLEKKLQEATEDEQKISLRAQLNALTTRFDILLKPLQTLHNKKFQCEEDLKKKVTGAVMDKGIAVALSSLALAGLTISLFFPPVGLAIVAATAITGGVYLVGRVTFPIIKRWVTSLASKKIAPQPEGSSDEQEDASATDQMLSRAETQTMDSTAKTINLLGGMNKVPRRAVEKDEDIDEDKVGAPGPIVEADVPDHEQPSNPTKDR